MELFDAGFKEVKISAESILPESLVVRYKILGLVDQFLCLILPNKFGYGLLAVAFVRVDTLNTRQQKLMDVLSISSKHDAASEYCRKEKI